MASKTESSFEEQFDYIGEDSLSGSDESNKTGSNFNDDDKQLAKKEDKNWDKERDDLDGHHGIKLEKAFFFVARVLIYLLSILLCILIVIWFYHLVAPKCYRWLDQKNVQSIERILFASTILSLAGKYFSKYKILKKN